MTPPPNRDAAIEHYRALADAAQAPRLREELRTANQLLRDARLRLGGMDPLSLRVDDFLSGKPVVEFPEEERDTSPDGLVLECYGAGFAWLKPEKP